MKRQLTSIEMVMVLVLGAVLIGFVVLGVPFASQEMNEGSLALLFSGDNAGQDIGFTGSEISSSVGDFETRFIYPPEVTNPGVRDLETRSIYSRGEWNIPLLAGEDPEVYFSPKDAIDKTSHWIIESNKVWWAAPANSGSEPSASAKAAVPDRYSSVTNDSGSPDYLNMRLLQQYKKEGLVSEANSGGESSVSANGEVAVRYSSVTSDNGSPDYLNMYLLRQYHQAK